MALNHVFQYSQTLDILDGGEPLQNLNLNFMFTMYKFRDSDIFL